MNPLTNTRNLSKLIDNEIKLGSVGTKKSWHNQYRDSAWVFFGGLPFELTEGDIICIFSQYGEVVNINLIRDKKTGKSRGFGFLCYENQLSTDLAVDNFNGAKILGRIIRCDHAGNYKPPKEYEDADEITKFLRESGCQGEFKPDQNKEKERNIKLEDSKHSKKDREKGKERERERERKHRSKSRSRSRTRSREREKNRDRDREKHRSNREHSNHYDHKNKHYSSKY